MVEGFDMFNTLTARGKVILSLIVFLFILSVCAAGYFAWQKHADTEAKLRQAIVLNQQQAQDKNILQNKLDLSNQNAEMLANFINKAQTGQVQPVNHFTVQAPSVQVAAEDVAKRINDKDPTLPPAALEKTDNTFISTNINKTPQANYDVAVFKNNNYRNWEWSVGYGQHGGDRYVPVELQRNFSKDAAVSYEHHFGGNEKGFEVKYTRKTDKLFLLL
jgi:flagellar basal body-associated protein FliL